MTRPVVPLHTLDQWLTLDPSVRSIILQNIRLKDRLERWLESQNGKPSRTQAEWVKCPRCHDSGSPGNVLLEPRYPGIHPSQLATSECLLKIYWEMEGIEQRSRFDAKTHLIFDIGHAVHHMFQAYGARGAWGDRYWAESRITETKQPLSAELMIEGSADAENILVIDNIPNAPIYELGIVHEYKTSKERNFDKLTRPKPEHKQQATIYAKVLNRPVVVFLYLCKDNSAMKDYPVEFDQAIWSPIEEKARHLVNLYERETPPGARSGHHCVDCPFLYRCPEGKSSQRR